MCATAGEAVLCIYSVYSIGSIEVNWSLKGGVVLGFGALGAISVSYSVAQHSTTPTKTPTE